MNPDIYVVIEHLRGKVADISYVMLAAARALARGTGGNVAAVLMGRGAETLANDLKADCRFYIDHPALADYNLEAYQRVLSRLISDNSPRVVLFGDTTIGAEVAGTLSTQMDLPLVSHCRTVIVENGTLKFVSQICGGKIMAEGELPEPTTLVTMVPGGYKPEDGRSPEQMPLDAVTAPDLDNLRIRLKEYIEPEVGSVDITTAPILIGVGRGIEREDNLELAEELAEVLGGVVCASRPIVDQGWLSTSRMVGKSGKTVKPKIYLALGISGAPEHVEGMDSSETIIAINTDPHAPIFDVAKYGAEVDLLDLLPVLTEQVQEARGK